MTTSSKPSSTRLYWRIAIFTLWLVAGGAVAMTVKGRLKQQKIASHIALAQENNNNENEVDSNKQFTKNPNGTISVHPQPAGTVFNVWNPKGIKDFKFFDINGKAVTKQDMLGKPWVISFIFTRCTTSCPVITRVMQSELLNRLKGVDVRLVSLTVDPEYDTSEILADYAQYRDTENGKWLFLTGDKKQIFDLIHNSFKQSAYDDKGQPVGMHVAHSNSVLHVDATGVIRGKYRGTNKVEMAKLRKALKKEAKEIFDRKKYPPFPQ